MAQHDGILDNAAGAAVRSDLNNLALALITMFSGATAPSPTYANQLWIDTSTTLIKKRNNANNAWNALASMDTMLATTSLAGMVGSLATTTEVLQGSNTTKAVTPDAIAALWERGSDVAAASTITLGEGGYFFITGAATITDIDFGTDKSGRGAWLLFGGANTLTHNASTLILPGLANITTASGDICFVISENGADAIRVLLYTRWDGTAVNASAAVSAASQAQQESASATTVYVSPGRQQFHPSAAKAWLKCSNSGTPTASQSYNVTSLTDNGTGDITVVIATDFSSATYAMEGMARYITSGGNAASLNIHDTVGPAAGSCRLKTIFANNGSDVDCDFGVSFHGDQ